MIANEAKIGVLYITYDGLSDPLGQSQIIPYLKLLADKNTKIVVLSFEKKDSLQKTKLIDSINLELKQQGIVWLRLKYHKRPSSLATLYDVLCGYIKGLLLTNKYKLSIVHTRGYIPAFIAFFLKKTSGGKFVFDMRGFWVDEKVDSGFWSKESTRYKIAKAVEKKMLNAADQVIVLAEKAKKLLIEEISVTADKIEVIPTCVDLKKFKLPKGKKQDLLRNKIVVLYSGSIGTFYGFNNAVDFFQTLYKRDNRSFFLALVNSGKGIAENLLKERGFPSDSYNILSLQHKEVSTWLREADISLMFYHRENSYAGCCPTKFGESLACGVPVIVNKNIGDCDDIIRKEKVGFILEEFADLEYQKAIDDLLDALNERDALRIRCRDVAERKFSLDEGVSRYLKIYNTQ